MALEHLHNKVGKVGYASAHADYIQRTGKYENSIENREELEGFGFGNMPRWAAHNPSIFWKAADEFERKNGTSYRELEIALPRELTPHQRKILLEDFIKKELGTTHAYTYGIHCPEALDGKDQPHAHLQFSERRNDEIVRDPDQYFKRYNPKNPAQGGCRKGYGPRAGQTLKAAERKAELKALRKRWENICNKHLELAGSDVRIDMRSYKDRSIELQPEQHQGPKKWAVLKEDSTAKQELENKRDLHRSVIDPSREELAAVAAVRNEISNPTAEIIQLQTAREARQRAAKAREAAELQRQIEAERAAAEAARQEAVAREKAACEAKEKLVLNTVATFPNAPKMWATELCKKGITSADFDATKDAYFRLPIAQRDIQNSSIYRDRNRNWSNAEHAAIAAQEREAAALLAVQETKAASEAHKGLFAFKAKGKKLKKAWNDASDKYEKAQADTTTKVAALYAAKKLLDTAQIDTVKSIQTIRAEQFDTALEELKAIEQKAERFQTLRTQAQELQHTGKITITAKQHNDWREFSEPEKQVIALYEIKRWHRSELTFMNFSSDTTNSRNIQIHPEQIHDVLEGKSPRVFSSSIKSALDKMKLPEKLQAIRSAVVEIVKRHAAPLVQNALELQREQQQTRETLERPAKQKERDDLPNVGTKFIR